MIISAETLTCCHEGCGISFDVPTHWCSKRRADHTNWFCPNGHEQHFPGETSEEKLRRERDRLLQRQAQLMDERAEAEKRAVRAEQATKRLKKRAAAGTCPCCQRTFSNMSAHMKTQHPAFLAENVVQLKKAK